MNESALPELTRTRSIASVPFGGRYRLIDFALSNLVNSGVDKVGIVTHFNYQSLTDHIGNGKDWDLARRSGGITFLPPFVYSKGLMEDLDYSTRMEALMSSMTFIERCEEDYIIMLDSDAVCNIDLQSVLLDHIQSGASLTLVTKPVAPEDLKQYCEPILVSSDENKRIVAKKRNPTGEEIASFGKDTVSVSTNIMVASMEYIRKVLRKGREKGYTSLYRDVLLKSLDKDHFHEYSFGGWYKTVSSMAAYYSCSMDLLSDPVRKEILNNEKRPVFTKVRNTAPTYYCDHACAKNSLVADGCVIEGTVENSILFRGVRVGKGTVIRNSILLQNTVTGDDVSLNCVISDKNVKITDGVSLSGHAKMPFFIEKDTEI